MRIKSSMYFRKVLIANRGEIAVRIIRTLKKLGIDSVVIYHELEKDAGYISQADESYSLGGGSLLDTFLNIKKIIDIAVESGCDAVHPGYGFLSENALFAKACNDNQIAFIGPSPGVISLMGNKQAANAFAEKLGIPVIPKIQGSINELEAKVPDNFFPCMIKATAGGGGKGMYLVKRKDSLKPLLIRASDEATRYFGNKEIYIEKYIEMPRHIEVQILADKQGHVIHLYERECSIQRRFQKIIEEAPAIFLTDSIRERLFNDSIRIAKESGYVGAGTIEFLVDSIGQNYFLEMNTRIQVEHPVTELITGVDIVEEQLAIAANQNIAERLPNVRIHGHAIEARIYAEDPDSNYQPSPGSIDLHSFPEKPYLRVDADLIDKQSIVSDFDPMIAKIIVHGNNRDEAVERLIDSINNTHIHGVKTNLDQLNSILQDEDYRNNKVFTSFLQTKKNFSQGKFSEWTEEAIHLAGVGIWLSLFKMPSDSLIQKNFNPSLFGNWEIHKNITCNLDNLEAKVFIERMELQYLKFTIQKQSYKITDINFNNQQISAKLSNQTRKFFYSWNGNSNTLSISMNHRVRQFIRMDLQNHQRNHGNINSSIAETPEIHAPLTGRIIKLPVKKGELTKKGDLLVVIESMKMENEIVMPQSGIINEILKKEGEIVTEGNLMFRLEFVDEPRDF